MLSTSQSIRCAGLAISARSSGQLTFSAAPNRDIKHQFPGLKVGSGHLLEATMLSACKRVSMTYMGQSSPMAVKRLPPGPVSSSSSCPTSSCFTTSSVASVSPDVAVRKAFCTASEARASVDAGAEAKMEASSSGWLSDDLILVRTHQKCFLIPERRYERHFQNFEAAR